MVANIMGDLAKIEHEQKLQRVQSGIRAAQRAGTWTDHLPRGFDIDEDRRLHVDTETFLKTREAFARLARGERKNVVAESTGIPRSTLVRLYDDDQRRAMCLVTRLPTTASAALSTNFAPFPRSTLMLPKTNSRQ